MPERTVKLPDVGEGVAEAELVEWRVKVGDLVREDAVLAAVMTDKATVEIPSPADGEVVWLGAEVGDTVAVGSAIVRIATGGAAEDVPAAADGETLRDDTPTPNASPQGGGGSPEASVTAPLQSGSGITELAYAAPVRGGGGFRQNALLPRSEDERPLASPAVRLRAKEAGIDLRQVSGSGPSGRIGHEDLDLFLKTGGRAPTSGGLSRNDSVTEVKLAGLRRRIAEKTALSASRIPHITYVEEVDVTALEELRAKLNGGKRHDRPKLTLIPFLMRAIVRAVAEQPHLNALFDDEAGILRQHGAVHIGIAAQTAAGLTVPVVRHAEARDLWDCAAETARVAEAAKNGTATRDELTGSTITITSLGPLGGIVTTPIINHPEVAIVGVNKIAIRPVWDGGAFAPKKMMNLSSSFDHRVVDGWDAAVFVQGIKSLLEMPAMIFVDG